MRGIEALESRVLLSATADWTLPVGTYAGTLSGGDPIPVNSELVVSSAQSGRFFGSWSFPGSPAYVGSGTTHGPSIRFVAEEQAPHFGGSKGVHDHLVLIAQLKSPSVLASSLVLSNPYHAGSGNCVAWEVRRSSIEFSTPEPIVAPIRPPTLASGVYHGALKDTLGYEFPLTATITHRNGIYIDLNSTSGGVYASNAQGSGHSANGTFYFHLVGDILGPRIERFTVSMKGQVINYGNDIAGTFETSHAGTIDRGTFSAVLQ